jgi:UDP-glucose 4-epimerase
MTNFYTHRRVLIVGGLGFIGSHLVKELVQRGARVTILDAMLPECGAELHRITPIRDRIVLNFSNLLDRDTLPYLLNGQSVIFCLAGLSGHVASMRSPLKDLENNCQAQLTLLECCRQANPSANLVFTSTRQVYGRAAYLPVDENHPLRPTDINGIHKLAAEQYFRLYSQVYGLNTITLRLTNTYGPQMNPHNAHKGFVDVFIRQALEGKKIRLFGDGSSQRDFNYITDVVYALLLAGEHASADGQAYNLGHYEHFSLREFVETLGSICPVQFECEPFPEEAIRIDIGDYYGDYSAFTRKTGWRPDVELAEGLERTLRYYDRVSEPAA